MSAIQVQKDTQIDIVMSSETHGTVRWSGPGFDSVYSIALAYDGTKNILHLDTPTQISINDSSDASRPWLAQATVGLVCEGLLAMTLALGKGFVDDEPGTFIAQKPPGEESL